MRALLIKFLLKLLFPEIQVNKNVVVERFTMQVHTGKGPSKARWYITTFENIPVRTSQDFLHLPEKLHVFRMLEDDTL